MTKRNILLIDTFSWHSAFMSHFLDRIRGIPCL